MGGAAGEMKNKAFSSASTGFELGPGALAELGKNYKTLQNITKCYTMLQNITKYQNKEPHPPNCFWTQNILCPRF